MPVPIIEDAAGINLSSRIAATTTVGASPALAAETIIGTLTLATDVTIASGIVLFGWAAYTVGTTGVSGQLRIRRTNVAGTVIGNGGAVTHAAAALAADPVFAVDTSPAIVGQVYVLTLQVASATAASTVSALFLGAFIV